MKKTIMALCVVIAAVLPFNAGAVESMHDRQLSIPFSAKLIDADGLPYDGGADIETWFYKSPSRDASELLYAESFSGVSVERGIIRLPLLTGSALNGTVFSQGAFSNAEIVYVDVKVDGAIMIELFPLKPWFAAMRAQHASVAEGFRSDLKLSEDELPAHSANAITSGTFGEELIPVFPAGKIASGTFELGQVPSFSASLVQSGTFPANVIPSNLEASRFSNGVLSNAVISSDVMRDGDVGIDFGIVEHNGSVPVPAGFERSQCHTVLSIRQAQADPKGSGVTKFSVGITGLHGEVTCTHTDRSCTANYLTICYK